VLRALEAERKSRKIRQKALLDHDPPMIDDVYLDEVRSGLRRDLGRLRPGPPAAF
jgi:hypothetical protein